jgi:glycosyltransferase involved in cell wall biosynthesis
MRVLHLITSAAYSPFLVDLVRHTDRSRVSLIVGSLAPTGDLHRSMKELGVEIVTLGCTRRAEYPRAIARLARFLRRHQVEVIHTHLVDASIVGLTAARLARGPACVMTRHHADATWLAGSRRGLAADRVLGRYLAEDVIAVSETTRRALIEIDGVHEAKITVVPHGFDWNRIEARTGTRNRLRREFGLGEDPVLCTVGRLDPLKGHEILFRAFIEAGLQKKAWLLLAGGGPDGTRLHQTARSYGIADRCLFTGHRRDIYDVMAAADLVVQPSLSESFGQVVIEALALARPLVATSVGIAEEVVLPRATGWLVPPGNATALAQALCDALADPDRARTYALAGQRRARQMYPIDRMLEGYEAIYRRRLLRRAGLLC